MAKQIGLLKVEGTLQGLTFYQSQNGLLVKGKGGVSKKRIQNDPAFARTRENGVEFGQSATAGRLLRSAAAQLVYKVKDRNLSSRLTKEMSIIKNLDATSLRGERKVYIGLQTAEGKEILKGFDFNSKASMHSVFFGTTTLDTITGALTVNSFVPKVQLRAPEGSTHFSLQNAFLNLDFETGLHDITFSTEDIFPYDMSALTTVLTPSAVPAGVGLKIYLFLIEYFQEVNGKLYPLNNGSYNVLQIVDVV